MSATLSLIRQDPARGGIARALVSSLAAGGMLRIAPDLGDRFAALRLDDLPGGFAPLYLLLTAMVATFVLGANAWTRSSRLALSLPLTTRRVWAVRTGCLVAVAVLSVGVLAATLGLSLDPETGRPAMNPAIAVAGLRSAATVLVLVFLYQLPQAGRDRIPVTAPYIVYLIFTSLVTLALSAVGLTSFAGTLFLAVVAGGLGVYTALRLPVTFSAGPTLAESETQAWSRPDENEVVTGPLVEEGLLGDARHPARTLHWVLFRALKNNVLAWFLILIVAASATVVTLEFFDGTNAFLPLFFLVLYHLPLMQTALENMAPFDPLPISRRVLWAHSAGPIIVATAAGVSVALVIGALNPQTVAQIEFSRCCVKVPWEYMEISRDGSVPTITAAWGESSTPRAHRLWRGAAVALYDPFEVGPESSPRFIEYQMRRAVEAVYGIPVPDALSDPAYRVPTDFGDGIDRGAFSLDVTRGRSAADRLRTAAVAVLVLTLLLTVMLVLALLQFGSSVHRTVFKRASIGMLILLVVVVVVVSVARLLGMTEVWYVGALLSIGMRSLAHWLPGPTWLLWIVCGTSWAGAYLLLERIFSSVEFPREKTMNRFAEEY